MLWRARNRAEYPIRQDSRESAGKNRLSNADAIPMIAASKRRLRPLDLTVTRAGINSEASAASTIMTATGIPISTAISRSIIPHTPAGKVVGSERGNQILQKCQRQFLEGAAAESPRCRTRRRTIAHHRAALGFQFYLFD